MPSVPRLPRKTTVHVTLCHACHVKPKWMSGCATPATQSAAASQAPKPVQARHPVPSVPRLPRKTTVDVTLCHACHVKRRWMSGCATPAICKGGCDFVPRLPRETKVDVRCLPRKVPRRHRRPSWSKRATQCHLSAASQAPKPVQARHPVPSVPRLPRKTTVDVSLCHACHAKRRWM